MTTTIVDKTMPQWEPLYKMWLQEGKPGWLAGPDGLTYQVLKPSDDDIKFAAREGMGDMYSSSSAKGLTHGK